MDEQRQAKIERLLAALRDIAGPGMVRHPLGGAVAMASRAMAALAEEDGGDRYYLDSDDDGHWYVVPLSRRAEFSAWLDSPDAAPPPGVVEVGGSPSLVRFPSFQLED